MSTVGGAGLTPPETGESRPPQANAANEQTPVGGRVSNLFPESRREQGAVEGEALGSRKITRQPKNLAGVSRIVAAVAHFFTAIGCFISGSCRHFIGKLSDFLNPKMKIFNALSEIPVDERAEVVRYALPIISPQMDQDSIETFTKTVTDFTNDKGELSKEILPFLTSKIFSSPSFFAWMSDDVDIIRVVASLNHEGRELISTHAGELFTPQMDASDRKGVIEGMRDILSQERGDVLDRALQFITQQTGASRRWMIEQAQYLPSQERGDIIDCALRLITPQMRASDRRRVIYYVSCIPFQERNDVITQALRLITPQTDADDRGYIIIKLCNIPSQERGDVVAHALQLITPGMSCYEVAAIIEMTAQVPRNQRDNFVRNRLENPNQVYMFTPHPHG